MLGFEPVQLWKLIARRDILTINHEKIPTNPNTKSSFLGGQTANLKNRKNVILTNNNGLSNHFYRTWPKKAF
jgi:hypothetical protein